MNSLSSKPFKSKTFYLDLTSYPHSNKLVKDLESLGAKEVFSIPSASFVVSDRAGIKFETSPTTPFPLLRSNSPNLFKGSSLDNIYSPAVNSPSHDKKYPVERLKPMSRGMSMMLKANEKSQGASNKRDILELCKKWKVKAYPIQKVLHYVEKYKSKLLKLQPGKKKQEVSSEIPQKITPPFIKMEDANRQFKPKYKTLTSKVTDTLLFKSVRILVRNSKHSRDSDNFVRPVFKEISVKPQTVLKKEPWRTEIASITRAPWCTSVSNSVSVCVPTNAVKEEKENQSNVNDAKKGKKKSKRQYCEICQAFYSEGDEHYEKDSHQKFLDNLENYEQVQAIISTLPSLDDFIAKNKAEEELSKDTSVEEIRLFEGPLSMESETNDKSDCYAKMSSNIDIDACMTERYTVDFNEYISETCSTPSTPLPFLANHESHSTTENTKPPTLVYFSHVNDSSNVFSTQNILSKPPELVPFNSIDVCSCTCSLSNFCGTTCPNCITDTTGNITYGLYSKQNCNDNNLENDLVSSFSEIPIVRKPMDILDYSNENLSLLRKNSVFVENLNLMQGNSVECSIEPIDLSLNQKVHIYMTETADIGQDSAINVSNCLLDMTKTSTDDDSHCLMDTTKISTENDSAYSTAGTAKISTEDLNSSLMKLTNNTSNFDCPKPVSMHVDSINMKGPFHESNIKINDNDCDTEIYNSDSDSDDNLNKIVEDCIEKVDKNLKTDFLSQSANTDIYIDSAAPTVVSEKSFNNSSTSIVLETSFEKVNNVTGNNSVCAAKASAQCEMNSKSSESSYLKKIGKHTIPAVSPPPKRMCTEKQFLWGQQCKNQSVETPVGDIGKKFPEVTCMQNGSPMINSKQLELPYLDKLCSNFIFKLSNNLVAEPTDSQTENFYCSSTLPKLNQSKNIIESSANFLLPENVKPEDINKFSDGNNPSDTPFEMPPTLHEMNVSDELIKPRDVAMLDEPPVLKPSVFCSTFETESSNSTHALFSNDLKPLNTISGPPILADSNKLSTISAVRESNFTNKAEHISGPSEMSNSGLLLYPLVQDIHLMGYNVNIEIPCNSESHSCNSLFKFPLLNSDNVKNSDEVTTNIQALKEANIVSEASEDSEDIYIVLDEVEDAKLQADTNESCCSSNEMILDIEQENSVKRIKLESYKNIYTKIQQSADFHTDFCPVKKFTHMDVGESFSDGNIEKWQGEVNSLASIAEETKEIVDIMNHLVTVVSNNITEHKDNAHDTLHVLSYPISESTENEYHEIDLESFKTNENQENDKHSEKVVDKVKLFIPSKINETYMNNKVCDTSSSEIAISSQTKKGKEVNQIDEISSYSEMPFESAKSFTSYVGPTISTVGINYSVINNTDSSGIVCHTYNHSGINGTASFEGENSSVNDSLNSGFQNDKSYCDNSCENVSDSSGIIDSPGIISMDYNCTNFETQSDKKDKPAQIVYLKSPKPCHDICV